MQNLHVASRPKFHVLSNGAIDFAVSPILCTGNWTQLAFSAYMTQLTGKPSAPFERALNFGIATLLAFYVYFVFLHDSCL
jgi:hypothetical protein